ncbi:hypothetical protein FRC11_009015, partial [Ceratobasidium sp. 423]
NISNEDKTTRLMHWLATKEKYGLGDFLASLFDPTTMSKLSHSAKISLSSWLRGNSRAGTRPAEVIDAIYRHPNGITRTNRTLNRAVFSRLASPTHPPTYANAHPQGISLLPGDGSCDLTKQQTNSREGIEELMVRGTLYLVEREAQHLADSDTGLGRGANLTWDSIEGLSREDQEQSIRQSAPIIWTLFSTIALVRSIVPTEDASSGSRGRRAYESASDAAHTAPQYFLLVFDNINKYHLARKQTVASKSRMKNGTAATAIVLEDVPTGAFDPKRYWDNVHTHPRQPESLTVDQLLNDIDPEHLETVGVGMIMRILLLYIPTLPAKLHSEVEAYFKDPDGCAKHILCLRKSIMHSMGTSNIDESKATGVSDILHDLVFTQMGMLPAWFDKLLVMVCGDQLTIDRLRKVIRYKATEETFYESRGWALPIIQLWHMKVAYLRSILKVHWFSKVGSSLFGFQQSVQALGRTLNMEKCEFYPCHAAVKTVFEGMVLTATYTLLQEQVGAVPMESDHMLLDLSQHFEAGGQYHNCTLPQLKNIAYLVYKHYMTTEAFRHTLGPPFPPGQDQVQESISAKLESYSQDSNYLTDGFQHSRCHDPGADQLLGNLILFMRDAFWYLEMASAIPEGDTGHVLEIIKPLRFSFWGSSAYNYGSELLELACGFMHEYSPELRQAILNNYLVNPSGHTGRWQECDFFQEHSNKAIKSVFNTKNAEWDSRFMRDAVSVNISNLARLPSLIIKYLGLGRVGSGRSHPDYTADINTLASHYLREKAFQSCSGRRQEILAVNMFDQGVNKLQSGALKDFLKRTAMSQASRSATHALGNSMNSTSAAEIAAENDEGNHSGESESMLGLGDEDLPVRPLIFDGGLLAEEASDEEFY